ncbi:MAG: ZIP family metal transporter [Elusimicrobia bacterium]|nr:ZIP family metal transporter [Elusimicrobiota bacterium]
MTRTLLGFNAAAFLFTLLGGVLPLAPGTLSPKWLWRLFSMRSGLLLAVAFVEVLPEAWRTSPAAAGWGAAGAFALLYAMGALVMSDACPEFLESCEKHLLSAAALSALFAHSFIDGLNLSAAFTAGSLAGAAVGTALALHKLLDGFTMTSLLSKSGYGRPAALAALAAVAAATPAGSALSALGFSSLPAGTAAAGLGFAAGSFIYIGASDVLPRIHKSDDRATLAFFAGGMALVALLRGRA